MGQRTTKNTGYPIDASYEDLMRHADSLRLFRRKIINSAEMLERTGVIKDAIVKRALDHRTLDRERENRHPFERNDNPLIDMQLHVLLGDIIQRVNNSESEPTEADIREDIYRFFRFALQF